MGEGGESSRECQLILESSKYMHNSFQIYMPIGSFPVYMN